MKKPMIHNQFNVYVDGGDRLLGLAEVTLPDFEAMSETLTGAGLMGEVEVPVTGQLTASTFTMSFKMLYGEPLNFVIGKTYRFDLRSALELEDTTTFERSVGAERWSIIGPIKKVSPGKRVPGGTADASVEAAVRRAEQYMDGRQIIEFDRLNDVYKVNGVDIYESIRSAIS